MPSADAEIYFIAAMMVLILVISAVAVFFFARTYKKEMRERAARAEAGKLERLMTEDADAAEEGQ